MTNDKPNGSSNMCIWVETDGADFIVNGFGPPGQVFLEIVIPESLEDRKILARFWQDTEDNGGRKLFGFKHNYFETIKLKCPKFGEGVNPITAWRNAFWKAVDQAVRARPQAFTK